MVKSPTKKCGSQVDPTSGIRSSPETIFWLFGDPRNPKHLQGATQGFRREELHLLKASPTNIKHWIDYYGNQKDME
jgi:hypothetical protein